jgi:hypothetical protein
MRPAAPARDALEGESFVSPSSILAAASFAALACAACSSSDPEPGPGQGESTLTDGPESAVHVASSNAVPPDFRGIDGDATVKAPTWYLAQWGIPAELPGGVRAPKDSDWQVGNAHARVNWLAQSRAYELAQDGSTAALPCGQEENLFLAPTTPSDYPGHAAGMMPSRPLSQLDTLTVALGLEIVDEHVAPRCVDAPNYAAYTLGIVLTDESLPEPQALYYQVMFRDSRALAVAHRWCPGYDAVDTPVFCVDDGLATVYGQPEPAVRGGRRTYSLDLLAPLRSVILSHHVKKGARQRVLDPDLGHWRVTGLYYGQIVMGGAVPTSRWDGFSLSQGW